MDLKVSEQQGAVIDDAELGFTQGAEAELRGTHSQAGAWERVSTPFN